MKILVCRYGALGDTVFSTSIIKPLIEKYGDNLRLDFLISDRVKVLFSHDERIHRLYCLKSYGWPLLLNKTKCKLVLDSMREPYDVIINLDTAKKSKSFMRYIRAKKKYGPPYNEIPHLSGEHAVSIYRSFYRNFLSESDLTFAYPSLSPEDSSLVKKKFNITKPYVVLNTTNSLTSRPGQKNFRAWPTRHWKRLLYLLQKGTDLQIILNGSSHPKELALINSLGPFNHNVINIAGKTTLSELISLISDSNAIVCTDTGPLHIAAATNTSIVSVFGPSDYRNTGPYVPPDRTDVKILSSNKSCSPCVKTKVFDDCKNNLCMQEVTPEYVFEIMNGIL